MATMQTQITLEGRIKGSEPNGVLRGRVQIAAALIATARSWQDGDVRLEIEHRDEGWSLVATCDEGADVIDIETQEHGPVTRT